MFIVLSNYDVDGLYRRRIAAERLVRDISKVINFSYWPELAPRIVVGNDYEDFIDQCHYLELQSISFWLDRSKLVWGRVSLRS